MTTSRKSATSSKKGKTFSFLGDQGDNQVRDLESLVQHRFFDMFFMILIVVSSCFMILEVQYSSFATGSALGYGEGEKWPHAKEVFYYADSMFGCLFTLEVVLKLAGLRTQFPTAWNLFDALVVVFWLADWVAHVNVGVPPLLLRLIRLVRVLRIVKLMRHLQMVDSLLLLITCIAHSAATLLWSSLLLLIIMMVSGLCLAFLMQDILVDDSMDLTDVQKAALFRYFGSFSKALLSMYELTLGNWVPITRTVTEGLGEWWTPLLLFYNLTINFGVVKVITGVFIQETMKTASVDDDLMILSKERQAAKYQTKMNAFFHEADTSGDGRLSWQEFAAILQNSKVKTWLSALDLDIRDAKSLFELLDHGDHEVECTELIAGMSRLRGHARALDLMVMQQQMGCVEVDMKELQDTVGGLTMQIRKLAELAKPKGAPPNSPAPKPTQEDARSTDQKDVAPVSTVLDEHQMQLGRCEVDGRLTSPHLAALLSRPSQDRQAAEQATRRMHHTWLVQSIARKTLELAPGSSVSQAELEESLSAVDLPGLKALAHKVGPQDLQPPQHPSHILADPHHGLNSDGSGLSRWLVDALANEHDTFKMQLDRRHSLLLSILEEKLSRAHRAQPGELGEQESALPLSSRFPGYINGSQPQAHMALTLPAAPQQLSSG